eukprot:1242581-Rhodomonas_salina.1
MSSNVPGHSSREPAASPQHTPPAPKPDPNLPPALVSPVTPVTPPAPSAILLASPTSSGPPRVDSL